MANIVLETGDSTSKAVTPDFDSGKGYYWMKAVREAETNGVLDHLPHKPRARMVTGAQRSWDDQVSRRLARRNYGGLGFSFDANGKIIREDKIA